MSVCALSEGECGNIHPIFHRIHISIVYSTVLGTNVHRPVHMRPTVILRVTPHVAHGEVFEKSVVIHMCTHVSSSWRRAQISTHSLLSLDRSIDVGAELPFRAHQELLRNAPGSLGAKLLVAATALRASEADIWAH